MGKVKIFHDTERNTLSVWFDDPEKEAVCEETGDEVVLVKDDEGNVIGFEKLNYLSEDIDSEGIDYSVA